MSNENNKMQVDIENLIKQNVNDLYSIKELYRKLKEVDEKISQIKYNDSTLANKLKKEYEKLKKIILDENAQAKLANDIETINLQLETITIIAPKTDNIVELQNFINSLTNNITLRFPKYEYNLGNVLLFKNKDKLKIDFGDSKFIMNKHGYGCIELDNCTNIDIKNGYLKGSGNFPTNTIDSEGTLHNEKTDSTIGWGSYRNGNKKTTAYNNGYLYNCGIGLLIRNGCKNINIENLESEKFNYSGISIGFSENANRNKNITIKNCKCHDNFDNGFNIQSVDGCSLLNCEAYNNGHPDATMNDVLINPGYGFTCRLSTSEISVANDVIIENCKAYNNKRKGIDAHSGKNIKFNNNYIDNCLVSGIAIVDSSGGIFENYKITNNIVKICGIIHNKPGVTTGGIVISADTFGEIKSNNLDNCSTLISNNGSWTCCCSVLKGDVIIKDNVFNNCGEKNCLVVNGNSCNVDNNTIINNTRTEDEEYIFRVLSPVGNITNNTLKINGNGMFLKDIKGEYVNNIIETTGTKTFTQNINLINRSNITLTNNLGYNETFTNCFRLIIASGTPKITDYSNIVNNFESHDNGIKINFKKSIQPIGSFYMPLNSVTNNNVQNIYQYGLTADYLTIGLGSTLVDVGQSYDKAKDISIMVFIISR